MSEPWPEDPGLCRRQGEKQVQWLWGGNKPDRFRDITKASVGGVTQRVRGAGTQKMGASHRSEEPRVLCPFAGGARKQGIVTSSRERGWTGL